MTVNGELTPDEWGILVGIIGAIAFAIYLLFQRRGRTQLVKQFAEENGLGFQRKLDTALRIILVKTKIANSSHSNAVVFQNNGVETIIFDTGTGGRHSRPYTAILCRGQSVTLPNFLLVPENSMVKLGERLGGFKDIDFASHAGFSNNYSLSGDNEEQIRKVFAPAVLDLLELGETVCLACQENTLVLTFDRKQLELDEYLDHQKKALGIFTLLLEVQTR